VHAVVDVLLIFAGLAATLVVIDAAVRTFVVPRGTVVLFTVVLFQVIRRGFDVLASPRRTYEARDRVMAFYAPVGLLALPLVSMLVVFGAFACIFAGIEHHGWRSAIMTSGSSLLTLGFERPPDLPAAFAAFSEATMGLALLALLITYLPTIYNTFSRREVAVTDLAIRAGTPPTPREMLVRAHRTGFLFEMDGFWTSWMAWFTEVQETHTSYGSLSFFRSPNPHRSWVTAAGAVLDTASVRLAVLDMPRTPAAALCIRSGYLALREVAGFYGFDYDDSPAPDDPISVTRDEFDDLYDKLVEAGVPVRTDRDQAWRDFAGWRVNYDRVLVTLAGFVMAPYAPWVSDRSAIEPLPHYKWGRRRIEITRRAQR
jgi:hypothetical protein